ncbi:MAG: hypothetical protein JWR80_2188 [Bradyrhizobium sp.]|nr:hypothetical protein [Bradyrhizobium sp.]
MNENVPGAGPPSARRVLLMLPIFAGLIAAYMALGTVLGIASLFAGIFFLLYWAGIKHADPKEFAPALLGGLGGLILAFLLHVLPVDFGAIGMAAALLLVVAAVYVQLRALCPLVINLAFMLHLTLGTVPSVAKDADFIGMGMAILLAASFFGGLLFLVRWLNRKRSASAEPA